MPTRPSAPTDAGQRYEAALARTDAAAKKAHGVYYTPAAIADALVEATVGALCRGMSLARLARVRVLDPACGAGALLCAAYRALLSAELAACLRASPAVRRRRLIETDGGWALRRSARRRVLARGVFGVDRDPDALAIARRALTQLAAGPERPDLHRDVERPQDRGPDVHLALGDSLLGPDFRPADVADDKGNDGADGSARARVPGFDWTAFGAGGFDVVITNPPWGQKQIVADAATKQYLRRAFPSSAGIFDWFRPFVELGIRLLAPRGRFGMVLPDIVLLKNYEATRRLMLDELALTEIDWLGMAFPGATIDAITIAGVRRRAGARHRVRVRVHDPKRPLDHDIPQRDFAANPRCAFNLFMTPPRRRVIRRLDRFPRLGEFFEAHEGVHSGNMRAALFVDAPVDDSCRPLVFGRREVRPYAVQWGGSYVRLSAVTGRQDARYANIGRRAWHERAKLLVRRTGDRVQAAVDSRGDYASNNFFVVFPRAEHPLDLDGLCAVLNSRLMTGYFRAVEPRRGRAFAELKIKHLSAFPLPRPAQRDACEALNRLGARRRVIASPAADSAADALDRAIDAATLALFGLVDNDLHDLRDLPLGES